MAMSDDEAHVRFEMYIDQETWDVVHGGGPVTWWDSESAWRPTSLDPDIFRNGVPMKIHTPDHEHALTWFTARPKG